MTVYAIDPGTEQSAVVWIRKGVIGGRIESNATLLGELSKRCAEDDAHLVIEQVQNYGMAVGREVFETVFWSGRFAERWEAMNGPCWSMLPRKDVKLALCGSVKAKDPNIRQALMDRYGGSQSVKKGGPLAGIKTHLWAALALAVTYQEKSDALVFHQSKMKGEG